MEIGGKMHYLSDLTILFCSRPKFYKKNTRLMILNDQLKFEVSKIFMNPRSIPEETLRE
jgi:hypothetical protein